MANFPNSLRILTIVSQVPQVRRIVYRKDCTILAPNYVLFNLIAATEHFAFYLHFIVDYPRKGSDLLVRSPPSLGDYLNLAQFTVTALYHLTIFGLYLYYPPNRAGGAKAYMISMYIGFLVISILPIIMELPMTPSREGDSMTNRSWLSDVYSVTHANVIHPVVTVLAIASLVPQVHELRLSSDPGAISVTGLTLQAFVFAILGFCWLLRLPLPGGYPRWRWYPLVGWATVDDLVFAFIQGMLWWIASRYDSRTLQSLGETESLIRR